MYIKGRYLKYKQPEIYKMSSPENFRNWPSAYSIFSLLVVAAAAFVFILYRNAVLFGGHNDTTEMVINAIIGIPVIMMWTMAFLSAVKLKSSAVAIRKTKDGEGMDRIADALILIAIYVVLITSSHYVVGMFKDSAGLGRVVSIENYLPLFTILVSSILLLDGALVLNRIVTLTIRWRYRLLFIAIWLLAAVSFLWRFHNVAGMATASGSLPLFVLPVKLLMFTYAIPHVLMWAIGVLACAYIANYSLHVRGSIYRSFLTYLYAGILLVYIGTYISQYFILANLSAKRFSVGLLLVIVLELLGILGFYLIYRGSEKLDRLEKI